MDLKQKESHGDQKETGLVDNTPNFYRRQNNSYDRTIMVMKYTRDS